MKFNNAFLTKNGCLAMQFDVQGVQNMRKKCYQGSKEDLITISIKEDNTHNYLSNGFPKQTVDAAINLFNKLKYKFNKR